MGISQLAPVLERRLNELVQRLDVPGAVVGVSHRGERMIAAAGVAGLRNPAPVTADTAFQLGSISKLYTATLLLTLAPPEIVDRPVSELVAEAGWMEPEITVGHLLTHSSGLAGDHFADTGRGDDALARYTAELQALPRDHPLAPGSRYSYCNSGFSVLGRLIEVLTGESYDEALKRHLLTPLNAERTTTLPEDTILGPVALGHNRRNDEPLTADAQWNFARASNPVGGVSATAGDALAFAERHLDSADPVTRRMCERRLEAPPLTRPSARGLGFAIYDVDGGTLVGHDGETLGQIASLRLVPEQRLAVVVLTNAIPDGNEITSALVKEALEPFGLKSPVFPAPGDAPPWHPQSYLGRYRNAMGDVVVQAGGGALHVTTHSRTEGLAEETETTRLVAITDGAFVDADTAEPTRAVRFGDPGEDGLMRSYFTGRIAWRVPPEG